MILAIPVSKSDIHLLAKKAEILKKFGPYPRHILVMCPDESVKQPTNEVFTQLAPLFQGAHFKPVNLAGMEGWPIASNRHFKLVASQIATMGLREAFYFFELDNTPLKTGWLDMLLDEYIEANKPYMGVVLPTRGYLQTPNGPIPQNGEDHMVGTGIYPPNLSTYSVKLSAVDRRSFWSRLPLEPFDVAMRHEIVPSAHNTKLIQHNWQTRNYREENGQIVCDDNEGIGPNESHKKPWDGVSVVIHGCKDDSLSDLVLKKGIKSHPIDSVKVETAAAGENATGSSAPTVADVPPSDGPKPFPSFLGTKIITALAGKAVKAVDLAKTLGVTVDQIKAEVANPANGLTISAGPGWVRKA